MAAIDQIASAIAVAIVQAIQQEKQDLTDVAVAGGNAATGGLLSDVGTLSNIISDVLGGIPVIGGLLADVTNPLNLVENAAGKVGTGFGLGYLLGTMGWELFQPEFRYFVHASEAAVTTQIFDPATAATLTARGVISPAFGASEASGGGIDGTHFNQLVDAAQTRPDVATLLEMLNRGLVKQSDVDLALTRHGYPPFWQGPLEALAQQLLSPADLALASLRGIMSDPDATAYAAKLGVNAADFTVLVGNTGEPPGLMQLLEAYRRGFIDQATLQRGIKQSRVRDEWIPTVEALRYTPMSTADTVRAVVENYITSDQGQAIAQQNGLEPAHWPILLESWGRPLAHGQMVQLYYRGLATRAQVDQAFRESDLKDKYINQSFELGVRLPSLWEVTNMLKDGAVTPAMATQLLLEQGYQQQVVAAIVAGHKPGAVTVQKHLTVADVTTMYDDGLVNRQQAGDTLKTLGYSQVDADWLLAIADAKAQAQIIKAEVTQVRTQFERRLIDPAQARTELGALGVDKPQADRLVTLWSAVRLTATRTLTEAQVMKVLKDQLITPDQANARLLALGYSQADADLLIQAYG